MAVPKRRFRAIGNLIKIQEANSKTENKETKNKKEVTPEEHETRIKMLKDLGLVK